MPTLEMSEALKEAYAVAPSDVFEYYTFEFVHPAWTEPVRVVYGWEAIEARIENPSEGNYAGQLVEWQPLPIEFTLPATIADEVPSFEFSFYDPSRIVMQKVFDSQKTNPEGIEMYLRIYLNNRLDIGPETNPVLHFSVGSVRIQQGSSMVSGRCVFTDYLGRSAPFRTYTLAEFPGLRRR